MDPGLPLDKDIYDLDPKEVSAIPVDARIAGSYVDYKRSKEVDAISLRPHPWEFALYGI
jgi:glutamine synthetase